MTRVLYTAATGLVTAIFVAMMVLAAQFGYTYRSYASTAAEFTVGVWHFERHSHTETWTITR